MKYAIYSVKKNGFIGENDTIVEGENAAKEFFSKHEAIEWLREEGMVQSVEDEWDYSLIKCIPCKSCGTHEGTEMRHDAYNIPTGTYCESCYNDDSKYGYRRDRYDYAANGERLEDDDDIPSYGRGSVDDMYDW